MQYGVGSYSTTAQNNFGRAATNVAGSSTIPFSDTVALNPSSDYTGPTFYGGAKWTNDQNVNRAFSRAQIRTDGGEGTFADSHITLALSTGTSFPSGGNATLAGVVIFNQADWLNGADTGPVELNSFSATTVGSLRTTNTTTEFRWVVESNGNYYLSNTVEDWYTLTKNSTQVRSFTLDSTDLASETWALYDPSTLNFNQTAASFGALPVTTVTAVSLYFEADQIVYDTSGFQQFSMAVREFSAVGTVVPEPAQVASLLGLLVFGLAVWKRRGKIA